MRTVKLLIAALLLSVAPAAATIKQPPHMVGTVSERSAIACDALHESWLYDAYDATSSSTCASPVGSSSTHMACVCRAGAWKDVTSSGVVLLAGRSGGQTIYGSPTAGQSLTLRGNSTATPGTVFIDDSAFVFNEAGADRDARFEGDTEQNLLFTDASTDRVGIGTNAPTHRLDVRLSGNSLAVARLQNTSASGFTGIEYYDQAGSSQLYIGTNNSTSRSRINSFWPIEVMTSSVERLSISAAGVGVWNDGGLDNDFRFEGDTDQNLIFLDASADAVGFGTSAPGAKLHVKSSGVVSILEGTGTETQFHFISNSAATPYIWMVRLAGATPSYTIRDSNAATEPFAIQAGAASNTLFLGVNRNIVLAAGSVTSGIGVIGIGGNATAPTTSPADTVQLWVADTVAGDANLYSRNEGSKVERLTGLTSRNSSQFNVANSTVLVNVTGLTHNVEAGKVYEIEAELATTSATGGGVKVAVAGTATATSIWYDGFTTDAGLITQGRSTALATAVAGVTPVSAAHVTIKGAIVVNAAGTLTIQFAQNASNASSSTVLANSWFNIRQIG